MKRKNLILSILLIILVILIVSFIYVFLNQEQDENLDDKDDNPANISTEVDDDFDIEIFKQSYEIDENVVISPLSIKLAMSMVAEGANGETLEQMQTVLGIDENSKDLYKEILENSVETDDINIDIANSIWINDNFTLQDDFLNTVNNYYKAKVENLNFSSANAATTINNWVKEQTKDKIPTIVEQIDENDLAVLINAIYFNARWKTSFDEEETSNEDFDIGDGSTVPVDLMYLDSELKYFENDDFQAVKLPYGEDGDYSMSIYLPTETSDISSFINTLTKEELDEWDNEFEYKEGLLRLPRFRTEFSKNLTEDLKVLGIEKAFEADADLTKIVESKPIFISQVQHKTYIDVTEQGTEAAAVTAVTLVTSTAISEEPPDRFEMIVDRPFFFTINDNRYNNILFMGTIINPAE
jgi:serpin B